MASATRPKSRDPPLIALEFFGEPLHLRILLNQSDPRMPSTDVDCPPSEQPEIGSALTLSHLKLNLCEAKLIGDEA